MAASHNDSYQLSQDPVFQNRVQAALLSAMVAIATEDPNLTPFHRERAIFIVNTMSSMANLSDAVLRFAGTVATFAAVISDATAAGTVVLTSGNRGSQGLLVTDVHLDSAISSQFNAFIRVPAG